jgi:hypothetical protein
MSDLRSATSRATLLNNLYAAAETLLQAVADPIILDDAPLNHRVQALDAIGRFIDRIEKHEAAQRTAEPEQAPELEKFDPDMPIVSITVAGMTVEMIDAYVAIELEESGPNRCLAGVYERIKYLREVNPAALERFDPEAAREWLKHKRPGEFSAIVWPDGEPHPAGLMSKPDQFKHTQLRPRTDPDYLRSQIRPLPQ